jgi:hypothetical protein
VNAGDQILVARLNGILEPFGVAIERGGQRRVCNPVFQGRGSSTPTSTLLIRQPSLSSKPTVFWKRSVLIDRCSILRDPVVIVIDVLPSLLTEQ